ncbi:MAG: transcriptional regulator [Thermoprotei archaeon]|nr:MAG: transcriptional regulator [Thermoprotei archaeon]
MIEGGKAVEQELKSLNPELMNPKRFLIVTFLYLFGPKTMGEIVKALNLTWGDLDSNVRRLREKGYVEVRKIPTLRGPRTAVKLTDRGVKEYRKLVEDLRSLLNLV